MYNAKTLKKQFYVWLVLVALTLAALLVANIGAVFAEPNSGFLTTFGKKAGKLNPPFRPNIFNYTLTVENQDGEGFYLVPKTENPSGKITYDGKTYNSNTRIMIPLTAGAIKKVELDVTDGTGTQKYTINIERLRPYTVVENVSPDWIYWADMEDPDKLTVGGGAYFYDGLNNGFKATPERGLGGSTGLSFQYMPKDGDTPAKANASAHMSIGRTNAAKTNTYATSTPPMLFPDIDFNDIYVRLYVRQQRDWGGWGNNEKFLRIHSFAHNGWSNGGGAQPFAMHIWMPNGPTGQYYLQQDPMTTIDLVDGETLKAKRWNDFDTGVMSWAGAGGATTSSYPIHAPEQNGEWFCVEIHLRLNDPGVKNGICETWIDGNLVLSRNNYYFIGKWDPGTEDFKVGINKIFFEHYWNNRENIPRPQWKDYDNIVISTSYIGPAELVFEGEADKTVLRAALTEAIGPNHRTPVYKLKESDYLPTVWAEYKKAVVDGLKIMADANASVADVTAATLALSNAKLDKLLPKVELEEDFEGEYLFYDDFTGNLSAYTEYNGRKDSKAGLYGGPGFVSTIAQGNLNAGALTFEQNDKQPKTAGGPALALDFGDETMTSAFIRFYTRTDFDWKVGTRSAKLFEVRLNPDDPETEPGDILASAEILPSGKMRVTLVDGKTLITKGSPFDRARTGIWAALELAIDLDEGRFELFVDGESQGKVENVVWPEPEEGKYTLELYNSVGDLSIYEQNRYFSHLAIAETGPIGLLDVEYDVFPTRTPSPTPRPTPTPTLPILTETASPGYTGSVTPTAPPITKLGDANCDGRADIDDVLLVRDAIFGTSAISPQGQANLKAFGIKLSVDHILFIRDMIFGMEP